MISGRDKVEYQTVFSNTARKCTNSNKRPWPYISSKATIQSSQRTWRQLQANKDDHCRFNTDHLNEWVEGFRAITKYTSGLDNTEVLCSWQKIMCHGLQFLKVPKNTPWHSGSSNAAHPRFHGGTVTGSLVQYKSNSMREEKLFMQTRFYLPRGTNLRRIELWYITICTP